MFAFNLLTLNKKVEKTKNFEPVSIQKYRQYIPQAPREIRKMIKMLNRCSNCNFLVFDNYWSEDITEKEIKVCPTCGNRL